jgi:hypothetical protein
MPALTIKINVDYDSLNRWVQSQIGTMQASLDRDADDIFRAFQNFLEVKGLTSEYVNSALAVKRVYDFSTYDSMHTLCNIELSATGQGKEFSRLCQSLGELSRK